MFVKPSRNFIDIKLVEDIVRYLDEKKSNKQPKSDIDEVLTSLFVSKMMVTGRSYIQTCATERMAQIYLNQAKDSKLSVEQVLQILSTDENEASIREMSIEIIKSLSKAFVKLIAPLDFSVVGGRSPLNNLDVFDVIERCTDGAGGIEDILSEIDTQEFFTATISKILSHDQKIQLTKSIHLEFEGDCIVAVKS